MKPYRKYYYGFFGWMMFEFYIPWSVFTIAIIGTVFYIIMLKFKLSFIFVYMLVIYGFLQGWYHQSIEAMFVSLWRIELMEDGIYGTRFFEPIYIFKEHRLMAKWEK